MTDTGHPDPLGHADDGVTPESEALVELLEAVDSILETAPCDCSDKRRYENGEHLSHCYLFDLNIARRKMTADGVAEGHHQTFAPTAPDDRES